MFTPILLALACGVPASPPDNDALATALLQQIPPDDPELPTRRPLDTVPGSGLQTMLPGLTQGVSLPSQDRAVIAAWWEQAVQRPAEAPMLNDFREPNATFEREQSERFVALHRRMSERLAADPQDELAHGVLGTATLFLERRSQGFYNQFYGYSLLATTIANEPTPPVPSCALYVADFPPTPDSTSARIACQVDLGAKMRIGGAANRVALEHFDALGQSHPESAWLQVAERLVGGQDYSDRPHASLAVPFQRGVSLELRGDDIVHEGRTVASLTDGRFPQDPAAESELVERLRERRGSSDEQTLYLGLPPDTPSAVILSLVRVGSLAGFGRFALEGYWMVPESTPTRGGGIALPFKQPVAPYTPYADELILLHEQMTANDLMVALENQHRRCQAQASCDGDTWAPFVVRVTK